MLKSMILAVGLALTATAAAQSPKQLTSTVVAVAEPPVRVAIATAGASALERYRSPDPGSYPPGVPLRLLLRDPVTGSKVAVTKAEYFGQHIQIALSTERGIAELCMKCNLPTSALVEIDLGALPAGVYTVVVEHTDLLGAGRVQAWKESYQFHVIAKPTTPQLP